MGPCGRGSTQPARGAFRRWSDAARRSPLCSAHSHTARIYLLLGFVALRIVWALGSGPEVWDTAINSLSHPLYTIFHVIGLVSVLFVGVRFFRLFPKSQPPRIGPAKPPPAGVIHAGLYVAWLAVTVVFAAILAGAVL